MTKYVVNPITNGLVIVAEPRPDDVLGADKVIDLFAGTGGMRLAFQQHDCKCVFSCEYDRKARETYEANFGEKPFGDIRELPIDTIPEHDILLAGFPCQPFSLAGVSKEFQLRTNSNNVALG